MNRFTYDGFNITPMSAVPDPQLQLSEKVAVSRKFRAEINEWLREEFGMGDAPCYIMDNRVFVSYATYFALRDNESVMKLSGVT